MRPTATLLSLLAIASVSGAQEDPGQPYWVSTPSDAGTALTNATAAVANQDWTGAAKALQEVFDKHVHSFAKTGRPNSYVGARHRAVLLLATMPQAVRTEYERLSGPAAERALRTALAGRDRVGLLTVVRRYEGTQAGLRAVLALADSAILMGRAADARLLLARIRRLHPQAAQQPDMLRRLALVAARDHAVGGPEPAGVEKLFDPGRIDSQETHAWPMIGGDARRTKRADVPRFHEIQYHFEINVPQRMYDHPPRPSQSFHLRPRRSYRADWDSHWRKFNPVHPVLARGYLVFGTGRQIESVNLYTGEAHWRYPESPEVGAKGRTNLSTLFSPVVADGIVYGAIEVPIAYHPQRLQNVPITYYLPSRRLVAISLDTGDVLWSHEDRALARGDDKRLKEMTIAGPPLVRGDRIYVGACRAHTDLFHHYLLAIDRRTGKLIYATHISNGQQELNLFGRKLNEAAGAPVAESDGVLYYGTNQGVFAAVDAMLGTPLWATTYRVVPIPSTYLWFEAPRRWPRFDNGPPMVQGDNVVVAPTDGTHIMALQRSTGRVLWRKRFVGDQEFGFRPRTLQGVDAERVFVSGDAGVAAIWLEAREGKHAAGATAWLRQFPGENPTGAGRGLLARGELWIPSYRAIYRYDPKTGKILVPIYTRKGRDEHTPVNLTAGDGVLITAGREFLCARYSEAEVLRLVKARMRSHPNAVGPILGAADVYLATGRLALAVERYKQARRFAATRGIQAVELRARQGLHRALLMRAEERMDQDVPEREFDLAIKAAPDATSRLRARLHLDSLLATRGVVMSKWRLRNLREIEREYGTDHMDEAGRTIRGWALRQMARILVRRNKTLQAIAVLHTLVENDPDSPDGRHASSELRSILLEKGRHHYFRYEKRAVKLFRSALRSGDLEALERGLLIYSNAEAAANATMELASRRLKQGDPTAAAHVLQRFLVERPAAAHVPQALLLMVRALHERRSYGPAYSALQRLKRLHSNATVRREDGARVPAAAVAAEWLKRPPYPQIAESARRRDLQPNLTLRFAKRFPNRSFVDVPDLLGRRPPALRDAVLLRMGRTLVALDSRGGDEMYRIEFDLHDPRGPLVLVNGRLLAVTEREVFAFDAKTGRALAKQRIPERGKGPALLEHKGQVFLLYRQRGTRGQVGVAALHPADVSPIWATTIPTDDAHERVDPRYTIGYRDRLMLFSEQPVHLTVVNTTSGAIENRVAVGGHKRARLAVPPKLLPDGRVVVGLTTRKQTEGFKWQHSYSIHLLDPSQPGKRVEVWEPYSPPHDGENRYLHVVNVIGDHIVALDDACGVAILSLRDGKQVKWTGRLDIGDPGARRPQLTANQAVHDSLLLVTTRARAGSPARLSAFEVPTLRRKYSQMLTTNARDTAGVIECDGVLGVVLMPNVQRGTRPRIRLYDPLTARMLQEIVPGGGRMSWFAAKVQNGILIVSSAGNAAYGYGPK